MLKQGRVLMEFPHWMTSVSHGSVISCHQDHEAHLDHDMLEGHQQCHWDVIGGLNSIHPHELVMS